MCEVKVWFFGSIAARLGDSLVLTVRPGSRVSDLLNFLDLGQEEVSICIVNGTQVNRDFVLPDGAEIMIIPVVAGG